MYDINEFENTLSRITSFLYYDNAVARLMTVCVLGCVVLLGCGDDAKTDASLSHDHYQIPEISQKSDTKVSYCGDNNCDVEKGETMLNCFTDCSIQSIDRHKSIKPNPGWIDPFPGR